MTQENLFCPDHKVSSKKFRDNYDAIFHKPSDEIKVWNNAITLTNKIKSIIINAMVAKIDADIRDIKKETP